MSRGLSRSGRTWSAVTDILARAALRDHITPAEGNLIRELAMDLGDRQGARRAIWFARQQCRKPERSATHGGR